MQDSSREPAGLFISLLASLFVLKTGSPASRSLQITWGILAPLAYLGAAANYSPFLGTSPWQSGRLADLAVLLHNWPHLALIYPLAAFSAVGLACLIWRPQWRRRSWVQLTMVSGAILWIELFVAWVIGTEGFGVVTLLIAPLALFLGAMPITWLMVGCSRSMPWKLRRLNWIIGVSVLGLIAVAGIIIALDVWWLSNFAEKIIQWCFALLIGDMFFAAPLAALTYSWVAYRSCRKPSGGPIRISLKALLTLMSLLAINFAAWRWAVNSMLAEYATFPTEEPQACFIASAAARGHRRFVGVDDDAWPINRQLRRLKAGELVLRHSAPRMHAGMRWVYNRLGPRAAGLLKRPWLADAAFVGLKPCEALACLLLRAAKIDPKRIDALYRQPASSPGL